MIVKDDHLPHGQLGIVQEAVVKMASHDWQHLILKRPTQLLYPLEIQCELAERSPPKAPFAPGSSESLSDKDNVIECVHPK